MVLHQMLGPVNGFASLAQKENSNAQVTHCIAHQQALVMKELESELEKIINVVIIKVNFVKYNGLPARLFRELCEDADSIPRCYFTLTYGGFLVAMFLITRGI